MIQKTISLMLCASGLSISAALGFSTDPSSLARNFNTTSAATNAPIVVTATFTNGGGAALRGFWYSEQMPTGLQVTTLGLWLNGQSVTNYTFESGLDSDVYPGCTPYRWVLEQPTGFTENNPVPANATVQIQYSITSPAVGSFNLQQFTWVGYNPANTNASFGYSESSDAQSVSFNAGSPPSYPILAIAASGMNFGANPGTNPASQTLGITNSGGGTLNWTAVANGSAPAWLTVSPANGVGNGTLNVSVASASLAPGVYSKAITVSGAGATNSPQTVTVNLTVNAGGSGTNHYDFTYPNRASLLAAGWDFLARTAAGATRNTEQTNGAVVSYDQVAHPGVLRIPVDVGDMWAAANNTRNSLFRNMPTNWTSLRLKLSFAPTQNYQQAGLLAYQDDDNYVNITRIYNSGNKVSFAREIGGSAVVLQSASVSATTNLELRLDRDATTGGISGYYSLDGTNWTAVGSGVIQSLNNARLAIFVGASPGGFPNADLAWAEVMAPQTTPILGVSPGNLTFSAVQGSNPAGQVFGITNGGGGTFNWTAVADASAPAWLAVSPTNGAGNGILSVAVASASLAPGVYSKAITVTAAGATNSPQTVTVNLTVNPPPSLSVNPGSLNFSVLQGSNLASQALGITNSGGGTLNWIAAADASAPAWLTVSPTNGVGNATASVAVASASLAPGVYSKTITVSAAGATNSPQTVTVNLTVNPSPPILSLNPAIFNFSVVQGSNPISQALGITNSGGGTLNWTAAADASTPAWLTVSPTNSVGNGILNVSVASASLAPGVYSKTITVSAAGATNSPQTVTVNLTVNSPPSLSVNPGSLNFSVLQGSNPASQALGITNSGGGTLNWTATADASAPAWLTVSPTNGVGNGTASVAVASASLAPGVYSKAITVTAVGATNSPQTATVNLTVNAGGSGTNHYDFTYPNRASLLAAGWDFLARTAAGATRNTEQTNGAVVSYDQVAHPGVLRIPVDVGDMWAAANNTRNSLFRNMPTNWTSLRLKLSFAPTQNYQQAGLLAYQDDDNYVNITRIYNSGNKVSFAREIGGSAVVLQSASVSATTNLELRLDRDATTGGISGYYSLDGTNWTAVGSGVIQSLNNARLAIFVGASPGGFPNADLAWAEVMAPQSAPMLAVSTDPVVIHAPGIANNRFGFGFLAQPDVTYVVEYKNVLSDPAWTTLTNIVGMGEFVPVVDPTAPGASRFYRIRVP